MKRQGFTLLEVLVATVIMAIAITGLLASLSTSLRNASKLTEADRAALLAHRKMDELIVDQQLPKFQVVEGLWDPMLMGGVRGGWRARVTPFDVPPDAGPGARILERIELQVWWESGSRPRTFNLEAYREAVMR